MPPNTPHQWWSGTLLDDAQLIAKAQAAGWIPQGTPSAQAAARWCRAKGITVLMVLPAS
jgi:hypothetical protein